MFRAFVIVLALCGCRDRELTHVKTVRDEVCACKSVGCAEEAMRKLPSGAIKPNHRQQTLANEMLSCTAKLYLKDRPSTDPDATSPGSAAPSSARTQ